MGVLLGDKLVDERMIRLTGELAPVTIGQSLRCTLSIPADGVPASHVLFARDQGRVVLRLAAGMAGRLGRDGKVERLDGACERAVVPGTRGKLTIGDVTVLFQELAAPPVAPRPQLPASVRGSLIDRVDPRLAIIVGASIVVHVALGAWALATHPEADLVASDDPPAEPYDPPDLAVTDVVLPDEPAPEPGPEPAPGPDDTSAPAPAPTPKPGVAAPAVPSRQTPRPATRPQPAPADADRWAQVMTGNTGGPDGQGEIPRRLPNVDLDQQVDDIRRRDSEVRVGRTPTTRDAPTRIGTTPDGPEIDEPDRVTVAPKREHPPIRIVPLAPHDPPPDPPTLTPAIVLARITARYLPGLQRCYERGLVTDPTLSAKVTLDFVVDETGASTDNHAGGGNAVVDRCIQGQMGSWQFPVPKDKDGDRTEAPFRIMLVLQPS